MSRLGANGVSRPGTESTPPVYPPAALVRGFMLSPGRLPGYIASSPRSDS